MSGAPPAVLAHGTILAHGVGSRQDLPLPFGLAVAGAATVLVLSFVALAVLWPAPRLDGAHAGRTLPGPVAALLDSRATRIALAGVGAAFTLYVLAALLIGRDDAGNPVPFVVFVLLWVGVVPLSVAFGPVWRRVNPVRSLHLAGSRVARLDPAVGLLPLPRRLGYWPAVVGLLAFTWLELVAPDNATLPVLRVAIALYVGAQLLGGLVFGSHWFDRGDAFEVWSGLFGRLSPLGGALTTGSSSGRHWGLDALPAAPGLVATVAVMLDTTAYDGASGSPRWFIFAQSAGSPTLVRTLGLVTVVAVVGLLFTAGTRLAGRAGGADPRSMPAAFAHSLVPIALGYVVGHYWSLLVLEGQNAVIHLADPLGTGANVLVLADRTPDTTLLAPTLVAVVQVLAIVGGTCSASCSPTTGRSACSPADGRSSASCRCWRSWCSRPAAGCSRCSAAEPPRQHAAVLGDHQKPCAQPQPSSTRRSRWARVSTPSALTRGPSEPVSTSNPATIRRRWCRQRRRLDAQLSVLAPDGHRGDSSGTAAHDTAAARVRQQHPQPPLVLVPSRTGPTGLLQVDSPGWRSASPSSTSSSAAVWSTLRCSTPTIPTWTAAATLTARSSTKTQAPAGSASRSSSSW